MALPIINGVVRCAAQGKVPSGQNWVNVIHARYTGGASNPGASDITALDALLLRLYTGTAFTTGTPWLTNCTTNTNINQISYTPLDGHTNSTVITHVAAGALSNSLPSEVAHVLTIRSTVRGRSGRGRIYLPCASTTAVTASGQHNATVTANIVTQVNGIVGALGGPTVAPFWELGVASYKLGIFYPFQNCQMDANPDVQRRRKS